MSPQAFWRRCGPGMLHAVFAVVAVLAVCMCLDMGMRLVNARPPEFVTAQKFADVNRLYLPHSSAHWYGALGQIQEFSNIVRTNALGLHDTDHAYAKDPSRYRILCLGDSFVEAHQVPLENTFFKILEQDLEASKTGPLADRRAEVISIGRSGAGALKEYSDLKELGMRFSPDLVIVFIFATNDFQDDVHEAEKIRSSQGRRIPVIHHPDPQVMRELRFYDRVQWFKKSVLNRWLAFKLTSLYRRWLRRGAGKAEAPDAYLIYVAPGALKDQQLERLRTDSLNLTTAAYLRMQALCRKRQADFAAVFVDDPRLTAGGKPVFYKNNIPQLEGVELDALRPQTMLKLAFNKAGIPWLDLADGFAAAAGHGEAMHFRYDQHWTEAGHRLAARLVESFLKDKVFAT